MYTYDMINKKFNKLTVIEECEERKRKEKQYKCVCDCGNITMVTGYSLRSGQTKSCGCLSKINHHKTHGKTHTRLYRIYNCMKERCYNKNAPQYKDWGGRNIIICDAWLNDFMNFYNWAVDNGYQDDLSIDRIDNDKGYSPDNCRWTDRTTQNNNKRSNVYLTFEGKNQSLQEWADELGIPKSRLQNRYYRHWSTKEILFGRDV